MSTLPHTDLLPHSLPDAVLVCGDPARADRMAAHLTDATKVADKREYRTYTGTFAGMPVAICSHGIGAPGAAIAFEELVAAGAKTIIRVGTCGSMQNGVREGDLVIATGAVQWTGYGREVVPPGFPAIADLDVTWQLRQAAKEETRPYHTGPVLTRDAFYAGIPSALVPDYHALAAAGVLAVEMECAALFLLGSLRPIRTGAILAVDGNVFAHGERMDQFQPNRAIVANAVEAGIAVALRALEHLHHDR